MRAAFVLIAMHWRADMSEDHSANVEWIIANAINEQARGDPNALAPHIIAALEKAGYRITPATEDTALGSQPFDELKPEMRPQDTYGDGRDWKFEPLSTGATSPTTCRKRSQRPIRRALGCLCPACPLR